MTNADYGMTAIKVEVFLTLIVPDVATLAFYYINIEKRIYVVKCHIVIVKSEEIRVKNPILFWIFSLILFTCYSFV